MREKTLTNQLNVKDNTTNEGHPLDSRSKVGSLDDLELMSGAYVGLHIYVEEENKEYVVTQLDGTDIDMENGLIPLEEFVNSNPNSILYTEQTLTSAQKTQARQNIGAGISNFSGSYNDLTNKPNIPDVSNKVDKVEGKGLSTNDYTDTDKTKVTNMFEIPAGASADKVLGYNNGAVAWVEKPSNGQDGEDGKSAYEIWYDENGYDDPTTYNEDYFLASLKAQFGSFVPAEYGTDGKPNDGSTDITASADTTNHIYLVDDDQDNPTAKVMWITIADETNPQSPVYTWISIGTVNVNLKFDSGESINNVKIDDTQLDHPTSNALAKAEDVLKLKAKLKGVTVDENKSNFTFGDGYINNLGEITGSTTEAHAEITLTDEIKYVRFLGLVISSEASSAIKTYSYAFYDTNNEVIGVKRYDRVESVTSGNVSDKHEYVISVPDNAVKFMCSVGSKNRDNFYCYLQSGNNIIDIINGTCNELKYEDEVTRNNLNWQLYPLGTRTYIYANNNSHTFASISSFQNVWYKEVKKDELIKIECIRACDMYFSSEMPNSDVEFTSSAIQEGVTVIRCNADGYISFSSYYFSTSKNASPVYLYILVPNIDACIKHILDVSLTNSKAIDTLVGSDTYGTVVGIDNNKWGLSPSIDVSGYTYIGIKVHYVATSFGYSGR